MNEKTTPTSNLPESAATPAAGLNRRRLVRAGLTAAPVMAALHSNTVLAGGSGHSCVRPSSFSSLTAVFMPSGTKMRVRTNSSHGMPLTWLTITYS